MIYKIYIVTHWTLDTQYVQRTNVFPESVLLIISENLSFTTFVRRFIDIVAVTCELFISLHNSNVGDRVRYGERRRHTELFRNIKK